MLKSLSRTVLPTESYSEILSTGLLSEQWFAVTLSNSGIDPITFKMSTRSQSVVTDIPFKVRCSETVASTTHQLAPGESVILKGGPTSLEWIVSIKSLAIRPGSVSARMTISSTNPASAVPVDPRTVAQVVGSDLMIASALLVAVGGASAGWVDTEQLIDAAEGDQVVKYENLAVGGTDMSSVDPMVFLDGLLLASPKEMLSQVDLGQLLLVSVCFTQFGASVGSIVSVGDFTLSITSTGYRLSQQGSMVAEITTPRYPKDVISFTVDGAACSLTNGTVTDAGVNQAIVIGAHPVSIGGADSAAGQLCGLFIGNDPETLGFVTEQLSKL